LAEGYIIAQVYTSRAIIPIMDASVSITQEKEDKRVVIGFRKTNENGKTYPVTITTPNEELSLSPGLRTPFTTCDVQIEHPDFYTIFIKDVQIFANTTSMQNAELVPIESGANTKNAVEAFRVLPQDL